MILFLRGKARERREFSNAHLFKIRTFMVWPLIPREHAPGNSTPMTSNLDIYRSANELIEQHGEDAPLHAAMRADELMETGDMDGRAVWLRIVKAVEELLANERPEGEKVH